jgi:hypothetical protein
MTDNLKARTEAAADQIITAARHNLADDGSRVVAVNRTASDAARGATAEIAHNAGQDMGGQRELHTAHLIIAELAVRLAEQDGQ